eukprot:6153277-Prymnesium_polylepis.2
MAAGGDRPLVQSPARVVTFASDDDECACEGARDKQDGCWRGLAPRVDEKHWSRRLTRLRVGPPRVLALRTAILRNVDLL